MNTPNTHPETGIRYGYISGNTLNPDILNDLTIYHGKDESWEEAMRQVRKEAEDEADALEEGWGELSPDPQTHLELVEAKYVELGYDDRDDYIDRRIEEAEDSICIEEPIHSGEYQGIKYRTSWLGGALNVFILDSPITGQFVGCSPCVPGAADLDHPEPGGVVGYDVHPSWRAEK